MTKTKDRHLVFGYGTLQHSLDWKTYDAQLKRLKAEYIGDGLALDRTIGRIDCYGYRWAGLLYCQGARAYGEVWSVDDNALKVLDMREQYKVGEPERSVYVREVISIHIRPFPENPESKRTYTQEVFAYTIDHNPLAGATSPSETWPLRTDGGHFGRIRTHERWEPTE